jgi:hypothetical protein
MSGRTFFSRAGAWAALAAALLAGCADSQVVPIPDAGGADAAPPPVLLCEAPHDCATQGFAGACRGGRCRADVPCGADAECGLGERCAAGACRFTGCLSDDDCGAGLCRTDVYACTECGTSADCPADAPVCSAQKRCVSCAKDTDCGFPGPGYCDGSRGACVHCLSDAHCPTGLSCGPAGVCHGAKLQEGCRVGVACDVGLMCVNVGTQSLCLKACDLYTNTCQGGQICIKLTFSDSPSLVFENGKPLGVCFNPIQGLRGYGQPCSNNCQPNLACTPDSLDVSTCKAYCDPNNPLCAPGFTCHAFPGDWNGHTYGLCYPDNGYADACLHDGDCRSGLACVPRDDPSTPTKLSNACAWAVGQAPAMAPCSANGACRSGHCRTDPAQGGPAYFCFGACTEDAHCSAEGRSGYCDTSFAFTTQYVKLPGAPVKGCRPGCASASECAAYGPQGGYTCRTVIDPQKVRLVQTCQAPWGAGPPAAGCLLDSECQDGFCLRRDGRGVVREGICARPCTAGADCPAQLSCDVRSLHLGNGPDGQLHTPDDLRVGGAFCGPGGCATDADCTPFSPRCVPDADPVNPLGALVLACRPPTTGAGAAGAACSADPACQSGVCAQVGTGTARACFLACDPAAPACPPGLSCVADGARLKNPDGTFQNFDACL